MSLLNKLWDDTIAGPPPDKGLGKLRKQSNLSFRSLNSDKESETAGNTAVEYPSMKVTRSIMIVKPERTLSDTPPASPAGSTPPEARRSGFGGNQHQMLLRRQVELEAGALVLPTSSEI
ncbi:dormancy-associated protein homolog 3 isoform X2 [Lactuca sativa]|uniref:dormancy-associated protein homolog 3 isoform X2 n=1 Tax=Lactuca sativa TaxID=4236 RepID=UPI0022AE7D63|nr:dormancy-associated protein homolog 3 isoform X2 [Lactuca sativa]